MSRAPVIGVIGENDPPPALAALAEEVGREIASAGAILVCGGLRGVMEAACRGAHRQGGVTIGILPGRRGEDANPYVTYPIPTGLGEARNILVVRAAQAIIAVGGKYGTLSEIAFAKVEGITVVGLDTWALKRDGVREDPIQRAPDPQAAVRMALEAARRRAG
jgi:uncharacterized protein (TIGR00725 family)